MAGTDKKAQNERAARGQAATTVVLVPEDNSVYGKAQRAREAVVEAFPIGAGIRRAVRALPGPLSMLGSDAAANLLTTQQGRVAARDAFDGFVGNPKGGQKVPVQPVEQALAQGREAMVQPNPITPMDRQSQMIAAILGSSLTVNEAATVSGILPQPTTKNAPSAKDTIAAQAAALAQEQFAGQVAQAKALEASDPTGAKAAVDSAAKLFLSQLTNLSGANPQQVVMAQQLDGGA